MTHVSRRFLVSLFALIVVLVFAHSSTEAQVLTKSGGHKVSAASSDQSYSGTANIVFSDIGELPGFEYPAGYEHIYVGSLLEGYSISYRIGDSDFHECTIHDNIETCCNGMNQVSYNVLQDDDAQLRIECKTSTLDGVLEITNLLEMNKAESRVFINMTVKNLTDGAVEDIRIKRVCDLDLDTGGEYGWADFDDWFELAENGVRTYTTDPPEGREAHEMTFYGIPTPTWFGADNWNDWCQRENTTGIEEGFSEADYPVFGDYTATLSWDLGDLPASGTSSTVTVVYQMGVYETNKPNAKATDSGGNDKNLFNPADGVYVTGDLFLPDSNVDVYVVADRGWSGGETITDDVGDGMNTVSSNAEGMIGPVNVWMPPLAGGDYDIVLDANRDGIYDQISDAVVGAGDTGFSVEYVKPSPGITDSEGNAKTLFDTSEDVYVSGSSFVPNSNVDIYVVADRSWSGGENIPADVGDGKNTVSANAEGMVGPVNVWAAPLVVGQYDIVFDANQNGMYDDLSDAVVSASETGFSVESFDLDEAVADAVAAGQQYLFDTFQDQEDGTGYWPDYSNLSGTCAAVAALIETGKTDDPAYLDKVQKGVEYIKQFVQENGGIYEFNQMYETGMALVALSLYDQDHTQGAGYEQIVQNAVDFLKGAQNLDGTSNEYGGWYYYHDSREGDLSNTQFAVMGLWYASRYLGLPVQGTAWANALLTFLERTQATHDGGTNDGAFSYFPNTNDFLGGSMTGAGIWSLAMIGQGNNPRAGKAVNWFDQNYTWDRNPGSYYDSSPDQAYYYFVYGMAKGLTATVGPGGLVGERDWSEDLKVQMVANQAPEGYWYRGGSLDPNQVICTSWVLMSLAFADPGTGSSEVFLPDLPNATYPILGLVVLQVGGGATISDAGRLNIDPEENPEENNFPIGGFNFVINVPGASSITMNIRPPAEVFDPENPYSFIYPDESIKDVNWYTMMSPWTDSGAPVEVDPGTGVIRVTLEDGGIGDSDGEVDGKITGPGAPGNEVALSSVTLPDLPDATYPILGDVTLEVGGGASITEAERLNIDPADNPDLINFPIGAFDFLIEHVDSETTTLTVIPPAEVWDPENPFSFVNSDESLKDVEWFKQLSDWISSGALVEVDREEEVIRVTLEDGGPGDSDGEVNGQIAGPGAVGNETIAFESPPQKGGTSQGDYRLVSVPLNSVPGSTLSEAIDSGVPPDWNYGADGDIRVFVWDAELQDYQELFGDADMSVLEEGSTYDMTGLAFWRIAQEDHSYRYMGMPLDPEDLPVDPDSEVPYFEIMLQSGWNHFGFPYNDIEKVDVQDVLISGDGQNYVPVPDESNTVSQRTIWEYEDITGDGSVDDNPDDGSDYDAAAYINRAFGYWLYVNDVPETEVTIRILYAPANGKSDMATFSVMAVEGEAPPPDPPTVVYATTNTGGSGSSASCFIATAAYGSVLHPHVQVLREFRDAYLLTHDPGKWFVDFYYRHGPKLAQVVAQHPALQFLTRALLLPLIGYGAFMVYGGLFLKLLVMAGLVFIAGCLVRRGFARQPLSYNLKT